MSDMAEAFFNAWIEIMSPPKFRLYCSWHVDQAWRKNLSKINTKEKQAFIYKNLRAVLEERDVTTFNILINKLYTMLLEDPDTMEFANYFNKYYMCCVECWAYCHRLGAGLNTNMHLERMHKTLKYTYLKGKKVKRLDKAINAIMRFVRDKCIDRLIVLNKGKMSSKLQIIRSRHKQSLKLREDLVVECENRWNIASETTAELYVIQKVQRDCKCQLLCNECKTCIHQFCCSCLDSSVKYNMCKHIHLLIRYISQCVTDSLEHPQELDKDVGESNLIIVEETMKEELHTLEAKAHLTELSTSTKLKTTSFESKKRRVASLLEELQHIVSFTTSDENEELDAIEKALVPIKHTLRALKNSKCIPGAKNKKPQEPHNKNIRKQRFFSTRKKPKPKNRKVRLETASNETALHLIPF
ncbi:uncharacterized protein LOC126745382 isoform X2 [Anthonomus grandis grandis]|uniref:uncharacterized protein LOC126745382 isoform X2 n=1 Tax=Anthonomus grandis grandis TaxID=2921223 RepID=UPI002165AEAB|nr:uncharacterized protein LOC126745382 isoform X2 [Anthonomus grandis grandis]